MANTVIKLKKSSEVNKAPASLEYGEIAINYADGRIYYKNASGQIAYVSGGEIPFNFGVVNVAGQLLIADTQGDYLTIINGDNIDLSANIFSDSFTISANLKPAFDKANNALPNTTGAVFNGNLNIKTDLSVGNNITSVNSVFFNTNASAVAAKGQIVWNGDDETFDLGMANGSILQVGQEILYRVKNQTGSTIPEGTVVMAAGTLGASGRILVTPAISNGTYPSKYLMGIATNDILNGGDGYVTHFGKVRGLNTSMWSEGDILYANVSVPGALQNTAPTAPNTKTTVAIVVSKHANNGELFVRPTYGSKLNEDELVEFGTLSEGDILYYANANGRFENRNTLVRAYQTINAAFAVANAAYGNANSVAVSANNYAGAMANSGNVYASTIVDANLIVARAYSNTSAAAANNYAGVMANSANVYASTIVDANLVIARIYSNNSAAAANNYAGVMANGAGTIANAAFSAANQAGVIANAAFAAGNNEYTFTNTVYAAVNSAFGVINSAFTQSNTDNVRLSAAYVVANAAFAAANTIAAYTPANAAFAAANQAGVVANNANTYGNSTYVKKAGDTITGDLVVQGNLTTSGVVTYANTQTLLIGDAIITLNNDIPAAVAPSEDAGIEVKRGSSANVSILWREGSDTWTLTENGTTWYDIATNNDVSSVATSANNYAGAMANSSNNYAGFMVNSSNSYAETIVAANLVTSRAYTNTSSNSSNNYAGVMANSSNNYAGAMTNAANAIASTIIAANLVTARAYTNTSTASANNYANATFLANTTGTFAGALTTTGSITANNLLTLTPFDNSLEGGQINLLGAGSNPTWTIDNYSTQMRIFTGGVGARSVSIFNAQGGANTADLYVSGNVTIGGASVAARMSVRNDRTILGYNQVWSTYNGASFENDAILGFNGTVTYFGNFQNYPLTFVTNNLERMRIDASGNVGIGVTPTNVLDVFGPVTTSFSPNIYNMKLTGSSSATSGNAGAGIAFRGYYSGSSLTTELALISGIKQNTIDGDYGGALIFGTRTNGSAGGSTERMRIDAIGNVGVGVSPLDKFHVQTTGRGTDGIVLTSSTAGALKFAANVGSGSWNGLVQTNDKVIMFNNGNSDTVCGLSIVPWSNTTSGIRMDHNGNVGIGVASTIYKFDVQGDARIRSNLYQDGAIELNATGSGNRYAYIDFRGDDTYTDYSLRIIRDNTGANAASWIQHRGRGNLNLYTYESSNIVFGTAASEIVRFTAGQYVGIGDSNPDTKLVVLRNTNSNTYNDIVSFRQGNNPSGSLHSRILFSQVTRNNMMIEAGDESNVKGSLLLQPYGGNVAIGVTSSTYTFQVYNSSTDVDYNISRFWSAAAVSGTSNTLIRIEKGSGYGGTIGGYITQGVGSGLVLGTLNGGTQLSTMWINNAGNVGIGTSGPSYKLHVVGSSYVSSDITAGAALYSNDGTTVSRIISSGGISYWGTTTNHPMVFQTNNTEQVRINTAGNVGIGATNPTTKLFIQSSSGSFTSPDNSGAASVMVYNSNTTSSSAHATVAVRVNGASSGNAYVSYDIAGVYGWSHGMDNTDGDKFKIINNWAFNGTPRLTIDSSGNVGIGTTSPANLLDVAGMIRMNSATQYTGITLQNGTYEFAKLYGQSATNDLGVLALNFTGTTNVLLRASGTNYINGGNFGVGTSSPSYLFHVSGGNSWFNNNSGDVQVRANVATFIHTLGGNFTVGSDPGDSLRAVTVGVKGSTRPVILTLRNVDNTNAFWDMVADGNTNRFYFQRFGASVPVMTFDGSEDVGIATSNPLTRLHVGAKVTDDASYTYDSNMLMVVHQTATGTSVLNDPRTVMMLARQGSGGQAFGAAAQFNLSRYENSSVNSRTRLDFTLAHGSFIGANTTVMTMLSSGNIGIGTAAPGARLQINPIGNLNAGGGVLDMSQAALVIGTTTTGIGFDSNQMEGNNTPIHVNYTSTTDVTLCFGGGKVGIGTASPAYKLEVNGSFAATTKSFVIDHPTQPGKKLRYGSLEGPENGVYIRGRLTNEHHIQFPEYWSELVDHDTITVQLTPIGKSKQPSVGDFTDNGVNIIGKNIDCYYFIMAERKDVDKLVVEFDA